MKAVELHLPQDHNTSFIVFQETGQYFPVPWHYHPHFEFVLVTQSTGRRMVGDHIGYFEPDDLVFLGSLLPHVWINDEEYLKGEAEEEANAIVIHFTSDFLGDEILKIPEMESFNKILQLSERGMVLRGKTKEVANEIIKAMPKMSGLQRISSLFKIFDLLTQQPEYELLASPTFVKNSNHATSDRFKKITGYIMQNFDQPIKLADIAELTNMSVTTFCNYFKTQFRMTFVEYVNSVRIGHACMLMSETDQNISEIAYKCGFNNLANFNRQFKKTKNQSPSQYRKNSHF
ncbi:AraC family transcriptional regulator [Membranihabitans marinus]|uniref:AraC family transcriptional regulator n=1 Tax=Membranihabitans marinus TaxID=1227546 RepID=UPI001F169A17|nr:AraC family transcriptional regulator [Membranihabitans marinus]